MISVSQAQHIQQLVGITANIAFKQSNKPIQHLGYEYVGMYTDLGGTFEVEYYSGQSVREVVWTILHELAHVNGVECCGECDRIAGNLVEFVMGELSD